MAPSKKKRSPRRSGEGTSKRRKAAGVVRTLIDQLKKTRDAVDAEIEKRKKEQGDGEQ